MSATASASAKPTDTKQEFPRLKFEPRPLFSPRRLTLSSSEEFPAYLPVSLVLTPEVKNGNIKVTVRDIEFSSPPPNPTWRFREGTVNTGKVVSIVMEDNLGDVLVLTSPEVDANGPKNTWNSKVLGRPANGTWSWQRLGRIDTFSSRFSWNFLLDPGKSNQDAPETIILEFDILVGGGEMGGILQQLSSFPPGWTATHFETSDAGISLWLTRSNSPSPETYILNGGRFTGGLSALVCLGSLTISNGTPGSVQKDAQTTFDGGTWTGTSGGPPSPGM